MIVKLSSVFGGNKGSRFFSLSAVVRMNLPSVIGILNSLAPSQLAEDWDNVGLLVEPSPPHTVERIMLTNDLTEDVLQESIDNKANMIISYHPPIFRSFKKLSNKNWKDRIIIKAIEHRMAIYSPHTASDSVQGGVNDWLANSLGNLSDIQPISRHTTASSDAVLFCRNPDENLLNLLTSGKDPFCEKLTSTSCNALLHCKSQNIKQITDTMQKMNIPPSNAHFLNLTPLTVGNTGAGRLCELDKPTTIKEVTEKVKAYLKLDFIRLALARGHTVNNPIKTIALCAGSGASVLSACEADLFLTGEMSHQEVLNATQSGTSVILCEHSNTERGYLSVLKNKLLEMSDGKLTIMISATDKDPICTV